MTSITVPNYSFLLGCSFGVMTQTRHKFPEFQSGKSVRTGICTIVRVKKPNLHIAVMNCVISIGPQMLAVLQHYILLEDKKGVWQWEELKHAVLGVIVLCSKFQGDLHCKES